MKTLIVTPTYNERKNIRELVSTLFELNPDFHILVVDDSSQDGTAEIVEELQADCTNLHLLSRNEKGGLGSAYIAGFNFALERDYEVIVQMDADMSHSPSYLPRMIDLLASNDVVVGSRYCQGGGSDENWSLYRKGLSAGGNWAIQFISGLKVNDCTSGFKVFKSQVLKDICWDEIHCSGFGFQIEIAMQCESLGFTTVSYTHLTLPTKA